ncbi:MAG TPA: exodeoxyribonuclease VII small subunit [Bacillota bacterium]
MENPNDNQASERSYEEALKRLEEIVERLEGGDLTLEESLSLFEEGIGLAKFCNGKLDAAEGRVEMLLGFEGNQPQTGPFKLSGEEE